jgi:hypothetical protein
MNEYQILSRNADGSIQINTVRAETDQGLNLPKDRSGRVLQGQELQDRISWASTWNELAPKPVPVVVPNYASARKSMYPNTAEQLDMLWHAMDSDQLPKVQPFYDTINAIKIANPKPTDPIIDAVG